MGLPVLVSVLKEDRDDLDLVRGALECLVCAMAQPQEQHTQPGYHTNQESQAGAINAELFARHPEHVQLLLNLLEQEPVSAKTIDYKLIQVQFYTLTINRQCTLASELALKQQNLKKNIQHLANSPHS